MDYNQLGDIFGKFTDELLALLDIGDKKLNEFVFEGISEMLNLYVRLGKNKQASLILGFAGILDSDINWIEKQGYSKEYTILTIYEAAEKFGLKSENFECAKKEELRKHHCLTATQKKIFDMDQKNLYNILSSPDNKGEEEYHSVTYRHGPIFRRHSDEMVIFKRKESDQKEESMAFRNGLKSEPPKRSSIKPR